MEGIQEGAGHALGCCGLRGTAYLGRNRDLHFGFFWSSDGDQRLFLEGLEKREVPVGHVRPRDGGLKKSSCLSFPALAKDREERPTRICGVFVIIC